MIHAKFWDGWIAFKHGKILRSKNRAVKVFGDEKAALKAARQSRMKFCLR